MSTEKNNDIVRKRQEDIDAKKAAGNNEIEETLNTVSYKVVKEEMNIKYQSLVLSIVFVSKEIENPMLELLLHRKSSLFIIDRNFMKFISFAS